MPLPHLYAALNWPPRVSVYCFPAPGSAADPMARLSSRSDSMTSAMCLSCLLLFSAAQQPAPFHQAELVFPLHPKHNHAPGIVECPNGELLASWYRGSGERSADDVAVYGARKRKGVWSD